MYELPLLTDGTLEYSVFGYVTSVIGGRAMKFFGRLSFQKCIRIFREDAKFFVLNSNLDEVTKVHIRHRPIFFVAHAKSRAS